MRGGVIQVSSTSLSARESSSSESTGSHTRARSSSFGVVIGNGLEMGIREGMDEAEADAVADVKDESALGRW